MSEIENPAVAQAFDRYPEPRRCRREDDAPPTVGLGCSVGDA